MKSASNARVLLTRQQYDEALAKLPDVREYKGEHVEIAVDARSLIKALKFRSTVAGAEDWPMTVLFDKVTPDPARFSGLDFEGPCWRLAPFYKIV